MSKEEHGRVNGLDFLRGVASLAVLAVCWFHITSFTYASPDGWFYAPLRRTGVYGWLGVEVFFVISGFVIPYSLHRAGYRLRSYPTFIAKRLVRLDPPYLASVLIVLALAVAYGLYKGHEPLVEDKPVDAARALLHLGYANVFFDYEWLNPTYWTLAIELQYYLLVGLAYPPLTARGAWTRGIAFACFGAVSLMTNRTLTGGVIPHSNFIVRFVPLFLLGAATFQRHARIAGTPLIVLSMPRRERSYTGSADSRARRARHHLRLSRLRIRAVHPSYDRLPN